MPLGASISLPSLRLPSLAQTSPRQGQCPGLSLVLSKGLRPQERTVGGVHSSLQGPGSCRAVYLPSVAKQALGQAFKAQLFQSR